MKKTGFRFRLIATILGVVLIFQALGFFVVYRIVVGAMREENERNILESFSKVETSIDWVLENALRLSFIIQSDDIFQAYLNREYQNEREKIIMQIELAAMIDRFLGRYNILNAVIMFREDGQIAGSSEPRRYFAYNPNHPFYYSDSYRFSVSNPNVITWNTSYIRHFFSQSVSTGAITERCIIIGIQRAVPARSLIEEQHPGSVLIVSVDESVLRRFYEQLAAEESQIVILNEQGRFFSGMDMEYFGTTPDYFEYISGEYGSFLWNGYMIIYYRLDSTGWYMVKNIPFWAHEQGLQAAITAVAGATAGFLLILLPAITAPVLHLTRKEIRQVEREKTRLEIETLQNQLRPHFLYNTITSIRWMATFSGAHDVANSLITLIRLIRPIYNNNALLWTLKEEYEFLQDYCNLMRMRYGKDVVLEVLEINSHLQSMMVPRFILQPIVENCFEHALNGRDCLKITIDVVTNHRIAKISITDDGAGIPPDRLEEINRRLETDDYNTPSGKSAERKGIGILNSHKRLKAVFGPDSSCCLKSGGLLCGSTTVSVKFPID